MSKNLANKFFARSLLLGSLVLAAYVNYIKVPSFHEWVNATFPIVKQQNIHLLGEGNGPAPESTPSASVEAPAPVAVATTPAPVAPPAPAPTVAVIAKPVLDTNVDLAQLSQSRTEWPKTLVLKKIVDFPAVLDGKIVGNVKAPAGTQVVLVMIKDGKVGVEYNGGGSMVDPTDTNLTEEVIAYRQQHGR